MSNHPIHLVLMYDHRADSLFWSTPAESRRLEAALPNMEYIGYFHPRWRELYERAPEKPILLAQEVG